MTLGQRLDDWFLRYYGSSRSSALIRIALALLVLYRFGPFYPYSIPSHGLLWAAIFYLSVFAMLFGVFARQAAFFVGLLTLSMYYYMYVYKGLAIWNHHHTYLLSFATVLTAFTPCGKSYSVDRWLALRRAASSGAPAPAEEGNLYGLRLLGIQMAALYFFAFWDKMFIAGRSGLFDNFLNGTRLEQIALFYYWGSGFQLSPYMGTIAAILAVSVCLLELVLPLMLFERFQNWLTVPGIGLHVGFYVLLPLATYSLTCIVLYLAFFNANKVHALIDMLGPDGGRDQPAGSTA